MPEDDEVLVEHHDAVLLLTFNRPESLNAWTPSMQRRYFELLDKAEHDPAVRAVVVTGSGRGFCAGTDLSALSGAPEVDDDVPPVSQPIRMRKPVIAAINGPVAGIGLIAALFADVRFAAAEAKFTTAFSRRGLVAEHGISWILPKLVGAGKALDLMLSARTFRGDEAHRIGLADRVMPAAEVLPTALEYARTLATECSPASLAEIKQQIYAGLDSGLETATADAHSRMIAAFDRPDVREGVRSFREGRPPDFPPLNG